MASWEENAANLKASPELTELQEDHEVHDEVADAYNAIFRHNDDDAVVPQSLAMAEVSTPKIDVLTNEQWKEHEEHLKETPQDKEEHKIAEERYQAKKTNEGLKDLKDLLGPLK